MSLYDGLTCNMKSTGSLKSTKNEKKVNVLCIIDQNYERSVVVLNYFRNFKGIQLIVEYNIEKTRREYLPMEKEINVRN